MLIPSEDSQGLGPYVLDLTFGHGGADEGFRAELLVWKETSNAVVIMVNSDNGSIMREIMLSIVKEYNLPDYTPMKRVFKEQSDEQLSRFVGKYDFKERGEADVSLKDDGLEFLGGLFTEPIYLWPESDSTFFNKKSGTRYNFSFDKGEVKEVKFSRITGEKVE